MKNIVRGKIYCFTKERGQALQWQDSTWRREDEQMAREIDNWGTKDQRKGKSENKVKS